MAGDARGHRAKHDDRRPPAAASRATSATSTFCLTYGDGVADVDIGAPVRVPPRARQLATRHGRAPAGPLRRDRARRRHGSTAFNEKPQATAAGSTAASSCFDPRSSDYIDDDATVLGARAARAPGARRPARRLSSTTGFWQPMDTLRDKPARRPVGSRARRRGRSGDVSWPRRRSRRAGVRRRVLVTGHTGFKGAWLASGSRAWARGSPATRWRPSTPPSLFDARRARPARRRRVVGDVRDAAAIARARRAEPRPEVVFHLAAQALVRRSLRRPGRDLRDQRHGHGARARGRARARRRCAPSSSSRATSATRTASGCAAYREDDALGGHDPYSAARRPPSSWPRRYRRSFFVAASPSTASALASARAGNVIGGGDWAEDRLVPDCVRGASPRATPIAIRNPTRRPALAARARAARRLPAARRRASRPAALASARASASPGTSDPRTIRRARCATWSRAWSPPGARGAGRIAGPARRHEAGVLRLSIDKALTRLDWRPRFGVRRDAGPHRGLVPRLPRRRAARRAGRAQRPPDRRLPRRGRRRGNGPVKLTESALAGAFVLDLEPIEDQRGFFARTFCQRCSARAGSRPPSSSATCPTTGGVAPCAACTTRRRRTRRPRSSRASPAASSTSSSICGAARRATGGGSASSSSRPPTARSTFRAASHTASRRWSMTARRLSDDPVPSPGGRAGRVLG